MLKKSYLFLLNQSDMTRSSVTRNGAQTNKRADVRMYFSPFVHLNTVAMRRNGDKHTKRWKKKMDKKKEKRNWSSEHRRNNTMVMSAKERRVVNMDPYDIAIGLVDSKASGKKEENPSEEVVDEMEGAFPDSQYPTPPDLESQIPDDLPRQEEQDEPHDEWICETCNNSPCLFLQWQEEMDRIVDIMAPEVTNDQKRYHMYHHMSCRLHGTLGKGNRKPLPLCFTQGVKELYPSDSYTGYKQNPFDSGPRGDRDQKKDDGSTYD